MIRVMCCLSFLVLACGSEDAKLADLTSDQLAGVCGEGTEFSVDTRTCNARLGGGVVLDEMGQVTIDADAQAEQIAAARAEGAASITLVTCGEGTTLDEANTRCRPILGGDVQLNEDSLLIEPTPGYGDERFAAGIDSVALVECADGTSLDASSLSCQPNLSEDVEVTSGVIGVKATVLDASFAAGVASVQLVTCEAGTALNETASACTPRLSADVGLDETGLAVPTQMYSDTRFAAGVASVVAITCDANSGVVLNGEGTSCVARLGIDVEFDGDQIAPTDAFYDAAVAEGRDSIDVVTCGFGTTQSQNLVCEPNLNFSVSMDFGTGELFPSDDYSLAAQACGVTASERVDSLPMTIILNDTGDGYDCMVVESPKVALFAGGISFDDAESDCQTRGGHLAWIEDETINDNLIGLCGLAPNQGEACLIGAKSPFLTWTEGSPMNYTNWSQLTNGSFGVLVNARGFDPGKWLQINGDLLDYPYLCRFRYPDADLANAISFVEL